MHATMRTHDRIAISAHSTVIRDGVLRAGFGADRGHGVSGRNIMDL